MSDQITVAHTQQYASNFELLLQQENSRLQAAVRTSNYVGKSAEVVQQIGAIELVAHVRGADTPLVNTPHDVRWVRPVDREAGQLIDVQDFLRTIADPKSSYVQTGVASANRSKDQAVIDAFFGTALTGEDMGTSVVWDTFTGANAGHLVDSGGTYNMTVAKLRAAKKALLAAEVDVEMDPLFCVINASMHDSLLSETQAVSLDYNTNGGGRPVLESGLIKSFMGFTFIHSELLPSRASSKHSAMVFAQSGMALGLWNDVTTRVTERADKSFAWMAYVAITRGATRVQEKKCVEIVCAD